MTGPATMAPVRLSRVWVLAAALLLGYVAAMAWWGRLPNTDEIVFKAAGYQWAQAGQFAAPEMTGYSYLEGADPPVERLYVAYPPIYPFLFGLVTWLTGFGWRECVLYDAVIHVLLVLAVVLWASRVDKRFWGVITALVVPILLLQGTLGRPDELATVFGMLALYWLGGDDKRFFRAVLAGVAFGLTAGTSPGAAVVLGMCAVAVLLTRAGSWRGHCAVIVVFGLSAAFTLGLVILPLLLTDPAALDQFFTHASRIKEHESLSYPLLWGFSWQYGKHLVVLNLGCFGVALVAGMLQPRILRWQEWASLWLGPLAGVLFLVFMMPGKYLYLWFVTPMLIVSALLTILRLAAVRPRTAVALGTFLAATIGVASLGKVKDFAVMVSLDDTQSFSFNEQKLREIIPDGSTVLTSDAWWMLRNRCEVYAAYYFSDPDLDLIDFVVLNCNGTGEPGRVVMPAGLGDYIQSNFVPVYDNLSRKPLELFGLRVTNSAYGFGPLVLARADRPAYRPE